jgi:amino acid transporter
MKDIETKVQHKETGFGTLPVYLTAASTILGAIMFLRFGQATGALGFWGVICIILLGHAITIPTALAISEIATNTRVEGGGEYFIISRSFGLKIGSTIGLTLYLSQAVSIAFYIVAFAEAFTFLFDWWRDFFGFGLPKQAVSIPAFVAMSYIILKKGSGSSMKMLYIVMGIMAVALFFFFMGSSTADSPEKASLIARNFTFKGEDSFFVWFAICFPAFTGMTAGVGLSGDLRNPGKSIPFGTMAGTITGLIVYVLIVWKLSVSATSGELLENQLIMSKIALWGAILIPVGLMSSTFSSALGMAIIAPRTLQALTQDRILPLNRFNYILSRGKGANNEPYNASLLSLAIALIFIMMGDVNAVAKIISMFFLFTYGALCLISFLNHFGAPPSYRPRFKSKWFLSLGGFLLSIWVMFKIDAIYTVVAWFLMIVIYLTIEQYNKSQKGLVNIFKGALFQLNRRLQVFMQKHQSNMENEEWRPAVVCISPNSLEREKALELMKWISYQHGFGTYFHYIEGYYSRETVVESKEALTQLIDSQKDRKNTLYIDTMISPSYTSAVAQVLQSPSISGMENNMIMFEYDKEAPDELKRILDNVALARAGNFDVCILGSTNLPVRYRNGIHVWLRALDETNANLMILLGYIILAHPDWHKSHITIFSITSDSEKEANRKELKERIATGRLPATLTNIEIITLSETQSFGSIITEHSKHAGLTLVGLREEIIRHEPLHFFNEFTGIGDVLFVNAIQSKEIK